MTNDEKRKGICSFMAGPYADDVTFVPWDGIATVKAQPLPAVQWLKPEPAQLGESASKSKSQ